MIPRTEPIWQGKSWQQILSEATLSIDELMQEVGLRADQLTDDRQAALAASKQFPLRAPRPYLRRIRYGDPFDPLLLQILPQAAEIEHYPGFCKDPLAETNVNPTPGIIHKYRGRVLLITTGACAIHCRYCFRRHFPYATNRSTSHSSPGASKWQAALGYIHQDPTIREVILSGGDPLVATDRDLRLLILELNKIPHLQRVRIHTRLPIVIPQRITPECLEWLNLGRLQTVMVLHCNHPAEIDDELAQALSCLNDAGIPLLNQAVLLKGINDKPATQIALSEKLFSHRVLPYYLHLLDQVEGAGHFQVSEEDAKALVKTLSSELSGYLLPRLVKEEPGADAKSPIHY